MTTPAGSSYYYDIKAAGAGQAPGSRCPRVLDIFMSGPRNRGFIYTPTLYRSPLNGTTLDLMISAQTGIDITKTGSTGIMVSYKKGIDGTQERVGNLLNVFIKYETFVRVFNKYCLYILYCKPNSRK